MLGWVLHDVPPEQRGPAFAHDAWVGDFKNHEELKRLPACGERNSSHVPHAYAAARIALGQGNPLKEASGMLACRHTSWSAMLLDQRAYVQKARRTQRAPSPDCGFGTRQLYNQVHVAWRREDLAAVFYVNDTHTARRAHAEGRATAEEAAGLLQEALKSR